MVCIFWLARVAQGVFVKKGSVKNKTGVVRHCFLTRVDPQHAIRDHLKFIGPARTPRFIGHSAEPSTRRVIGSNQTVARFSERDPSFARNRLLRGPMHQAAHLRLQYHLPGMRCATRHQRSPGRDNSGRTHLAPRSGVIGQGMSGTNRCRIANSSSCRMNFPLLFRWPKPKPSLFERHPIDCTRLLKNNRSRRIAVVGLRIVPLLSSRNQQFSP